MRASDHLDAGHRQAFVERVFELVVDRLAIRAQRQFIVLNPVIVISIAAGDLTQRSVALHTHEIFEDVHAGRSRNPGLSGSRRSVDLEDRLIDIVALDLPHQHQTDHNRIARLVVHLDRIDVQVAGADRNLLGRHKWIDPPVARFVEGALVFAEEDHDAGFVGFEQHEARHADQHAETPDRADHDRPTPNASPASIRCAPNTIAHTPSANPTKISVKARKPLHFQPL